MRHDPSLTTRLEVPRLPAELLSAASKLPTATLHEAGKKIGALPSALAPLDRGMRLCGQALTVHSPPGDNLWLHRALDIAQPGDVLVVHCSGAFEHGYWGEIMATAAKERSLGGLVIDGCVRDGDLLEDLGFPVFARGLCIRGTGKDFGARGWISRPVRIRELTVSAGDLVVGDRDGVVVVPGPRAHEIVAAAEQREAKEAHVLQRIAAGDRTLEIYNF